MTRSEVLKRIAALALVVGSALVAPGQQGGTTVVTATPGPGHVTKSADRPQGFSSPVPSGIPAAKKVFVSNGGAPAGLFPHPFTGTQDRGYGLLYTLLGANSALQLVGSPGEADLVLELTLSAPVGSLGGDKAHGTEDALPEFKLMIYDRPTHYLLWVITQTIDKAAFQKAHDKNFDDALALLAGQYSLLAASGK
jgi:hypothetical protein